MKNTKKLKIGIVGAGLMGVKRAAAIKSAGLGALVAVADADYKKAKEFAKTYKCDAAPGWKNLVSREDINVVIVSVPNKFTAPIAIAALRGGKHVLCEKPFGRSTTESLQIIAAAKKYGGLVKVGLNHRFQPAISLAKKIFDRGLIGRLLFIRVRYGHGGRAGLEKEWRSSEDLAGGGVLLDLGPHIVDLARWFGGEFDEVYGWAQTKFWPIKVDDNAFVLMKNKNVTVSFHVSTTSWKNIFSFEIFGDKGFLAIDGKGGSYGKEKLTFGRRPERFGVPKLRHFSFSKDVSWNEEWKNFVAAINEKAKIVGGSGDGLEANRIVEAIYKSSRSGKSVKL